MNILLDGQKVKTPTEFNIEKYNITKATRLASGLMTMDLIAKKRKFLFTYEVLSGAELQKILNIIDANKMFFPIQYQENGTNKTATVYTGPITASKYRTTTGWYWKNVTFNLIEQ